MFTVGQSYYNESIRKLVLTFGSIFESVYVTRINVDGTVKERIRVPIAYSSKEKFIARLTQESSLSKNSRVEIVLPRLGFEMTTMVYDPSRKLNRTIQRADIVDGVYKSSFAEVPYVITFGLYAFTRNMDDMLQIIEQIVPYFAPDYTVTVKMNDLQQAVDIPFVLNNVNLDESYEGAVETRRTLIGSFDFSAKTYIYPNICGATGGIIERTDINFYDGQDEVSGSIYAGDVGYTGNHVTGSITEVRGNWP